MTGRPHHPPQTPNRIDCIRFAECVCALLLIALLPCRADANVAPASAPAPGLSSIATSPVDGPGAAVRTNLPAPTPSEQALQIRMREQLEAARYLRTIRQARDAEPILIELVADSSPEPIQQSALLELAAAAQDENELSRAQQVYSQFLARWPNDSRIPEVLLRQGQLFRRMGMYNLAFTKFYAVMTSALVLKSEQVDYYYRLVLQAQTEIAETHFELGKYAESAEFLARLLKQNDPAINKPELLYKLARSHSALGQYERAVADTQSYLSLYPDAPEQPEIRFHLALALKQLGRNQESLQQVLLLLREQRERTKDRPELWAYWQQRTGNLIANQLYREGDYTEALDIYLNLAQLDGSPLWQLPVYYQIGMTYERLWQLDKAAETYNHILSREKDLVGASPGLKTIFEMSRWRIQFLDWQQRAELITRQLHATAPAKSDSAPGTAPAPPVTP